MDREKMDHWWGHLHWLTVLAEHGSYTAAAVRLGVSKAAMSQRIADLERTAGMPLVQRTTRSVRLTEAGQRLVEGVRAPFDQIAAQFEHLRDQGGAPRGRVRVTAPVALARQQLVPLLAGFLQRYPEVRLELDMSDRLASLASEGFDLAIRHTAQPPDTHVAWALCDTRSVLVASPAYLQRQGVPAHPQDLLRHDCLHYPRAQATPVWAFEPLAMAQADDGAAMERVSVPVRGPFSANNSEALRDAAVAGLGVAVVPDFSAQAALDQGRLVVLLPAWRPVGAFAGQLYAIRPYAAHVPQAVSALVAHLRQALAPGFGPIPIKTDAA